MCFIIYNRTFTNNFNYLLYETLHLILIHDSNSAVG